MTTTTTQKEEPTESNDGNNNSAKNKPTEKAVVVVEEESKEAEVDTPADNDGVESKDVLISRQLSSRESMLDASADPFAPRQGKTLTWCNVNMILVRTPTTCHATMKQFSNG